MTRGADKGYDLQEFVGQLRRQKLTPHVARNDYITKSGKRRRSVVDGPTTRHPGYGISNVAEEGERRFKILGGAGDGSPIK